MKKGEKSDVPYQFFFYVLRPLESEKMIFMKVSVCGRSYI